ncbi:chloride channel protein [Anopheles sinensis]|uniref:Chloride channel protein n=1 Tax=Anopheles sinensis TaxID=74873 RepID=A0A084WGH5_ANOSI|nr:chloride channel protein [Anopheles sinensis]
MSFPYLVPFGTVVQFNITPGTFVSIKAYFKADHTWEIRYRKWRGSVTAHRCHNTYSGNAKRRWWSHSPYRTPFGVTAGIHTLALVKTVILKHSCGPLARAGGQAIAARDRATRSSERLVEVAIVSTPADKG